MATKESGHIPWGKLRRKPAILVLVMEEARSIFAPENMNMERRKTRKMGPSETGRHRRKET